MVVKLSFAEEGIVETEKSYISKSYQILKDLSKLSKAG